MSHRDIAVCVCVAVMMQGALVTLVLGLTLGRQK